MFGGVVLAAGASTRLGRPKALVSVNGDPAIAHVVRMLHEAGAQATVVVTGADEARVKTAVPAMAKVVHHPGWERGQTSSVKAGLSALPANLDMVLWPVDRPAVAASTLAALVGGAGSIRVPSHGGHRGHPTLFAASLRHEILAIADDRPLHSILHARPERVVEVPVVDPAIHFNVDTPADVERLEAHLGRLRRARPLA